MSIEYQKVQSCTPEDSRVFCTRLRTDPEDSVVAHSLFDPHIEPQDADGELEDPSMLPSSGVGYELEKRDQLREDEAATGAAAGSKQHKRAAEDEELQREEQIDEKEEMQHGKAQPPPPKLPPDEARKLLLSVR
ncbi:hypothetical protein, conserved [Eimeria acervulina]|uniref:Uncharacterized protein n=1 Tax=Eimeria acervulina TaxID=5801 RepID=U6G7C2_EIMAC|nr:hypothetical protein, conserved [Eimeria acervulina]CDI76146.1 hypothetical protein, conserved [Eimeria acervulina]